MQYGRKLVRVKKSFYEVEEEKKKQLAEQKGKIKNADHQESSVS